MGAPGWFTSTWLAGVTTLSRARPIEHAERDRGAPWCGVVSQLCSSVLERNERWAKRYFAFQPRQFPPRGT